MSKNFGLRKSGMQKQSEPVTPQFTQCHTTVGCYFIFPPLFVQLWERNGAVDPPNALAPVPVPAPAAIPIPSPSPNPPSQRNPT